MQCPGCEAPLPDDATECPACGSTLAPPVPPGEPRAGKPSDAAAIGGPRVEAHAEAEAPADAGTSSEPHGEPETQPSGPGRRAKRRTARVATTIAALVVAMVAMNVVGVVFLLPTAPTTTKMPPAYAPVKVNTSFIDTGTLSPEDAQALEASAAVSVVVTFYETIDAGDFAALGALVTSGTQSEVATGTFKSWEPTTFTGVRSTVESDTALVFGHESRRAFGSKARGVKFTLRRSEAGWSIQSWEAVDEGAVNGAMPSSGQGAGATALTAETSRDLIDTLLQARQKGDADTIRLLTTARFQKANGAAWLDGVDNSAFFTKFTITSVKKRGRAFAVTARETWNSGIETATYRVIEAAGSLLADTRTSR